VVISPRTGSRSIVVVVVAIGTVVAVVVTTLVEVVVAATLVTVDGVWPRVRQPVSISRRQMGRAPLRKSRLDLITPRS
jgi:hypothetical protein